MSFLTRFMVPAPLPTECRPPATVATVATDAPPAAFRLWHIHHPDGRLVEVSCTPPATEAELCARYPEASLEPITDHQEAAAHGQA